MIHLLIYLGVCWLLAYIGRYHKFGFWPYFLLSLFLSPFIGLLLIIASDKRRGRAG